MLNDIVKRLALFLIALIPSLSYAAQDDELDAYLSMTIEELMELEVTISTNTRQNLKQAPSTVTVLTANDFKATGATNLVDLLEAVPGLHIRMNPFGYRPMVQFRGAKAQQTLLMINGEPMRDLLWGFGIYWKGLPASIIDRVEIIRGPGSALFGADASAGVINVITKTAAGIDSNEFGLRKGSFDTDTGWLQLSDEWNDFNFGLTLDLFNTQGPDIHIQEDYQSRFDAEHDTQSSLAPGYAEFGWKNRDIRFSLTRMDWQLLVDYTNQSEVQTGLTGAGIIDPVTEGESSRFNLALKYNNEDYSDDWSLYSELRYQNLKYDSGDGFQEIPPGFLGSSSQFALINKLRSSERRLSFELSSLYKGLEHQEIQVGAGYSHQDPYRLEQYTNGIYVSGTFIPIEDGFLDLSEVSNAIPPEKTRISKHVYLQDIVQLSEGWELTAGLRYDLYSDFGNSYNPRAALVWNTTRKLTTKLLYGRAFRPPSYRELYALTADALPNPDLKPERSETWELALSYLVSRDLSFGMNLFQYEQQDIISKAPINPNSTLRQYVNIGEHTIHGIEIEAMWQPLKTLKLSGNYTYRQQDETPYRAVDEPDQDAYLRIDWSLRKDWQWNFQSNWIGERIRTETDTRDDLEDYTISDTTVRYLGMKNLEFCLSIRNIFDTEAYDYTSATLPGDLPLPGRNLYAEIRYLPNQPD
ncbi:MAG: TonB-dependent receptor [Candidatus Thiodiazotropha sp.]